MQLRARVHACKNAPNVRAQVTSNGSSALNGGADRAMAVDLKKDEGKMDTDEVSTSTEKEAEMTAELLDQCEAGKSGRKEKGADE